MDADGQSRNGQPPDDRDAADPERDPADVDGLGLESLWKLCEPPGGAVADPLLGREFDGLRLLRVVGEGGMGRVYEAERLDGSGTVAVKVLRPGLWSHELVRRFAKESEILRRLDHPGISRILAVGACDVVGTAVPYIAMEFVPDAKPITAFVREHHLRGDAIDEMVARVCDAVAHGHAAGIVHRDLKPANILIDAAGQPKVIDFGVARGRTVGAPDSTLTMPGGLVGTLQYMSPEQLASGGLAVDARTDVHALGAILHELYEGSPPFALGDLSVVEAARTIQESPPREPRQMPPHLAAVVAACLAKDPDLRPADAAALAALLRGGGSPRPSVAGRAAVSAPGRRHPARRGEVVRGTFAGLLLGATLVFGVQLVRNWAFYERIAGDARDGVAALLSRFDREERVVFEHAFRSVEQWDADRWLLESTGMRKWEEEESSPRINYWGPAVDGVEGSLVYRFEFPVPAERIGLVFQITCWDFPRSSVIGKGRGAATVEASRDGTDWIALHDGIAAGAWGESWGISGDLPAEFAGTSALWLRIRLVSEGAGDGYSVAQFVRSSIGAPDDTFLVRAWARGGPATTR